MIPDSLPCQNKSLAKALYEDSPQESLLVPILQSKKSHKPIKYTQTVPITLPLVPLIKTGSKFPKNPFSLAHKNSPTQKLSLASKFQNSPLISQTSSLTLPQFKNFQTGAPCQAYPNHPNLTNVYVHKSKDALIQTSSNIPPIPKRPPEIK
ncbi:hypothetical protein O181_107088 [Austropuccinia psidii MF-1]|uniref:Uncharacterized protein n=1 Tax=Austropuccinia psidii MF-1 TaxID=1389203 RepID=A0A9Q3JRW6_9BASI|nr:hypothetical protein [Austropuccinia psidii MF-1]